MDASFGRLQEQITGWIIKRGVKLVTESVLELVPQKVWTDFGNEIKGAFCTERKRRSECRHRIRWQVRSGADGLFSFRTCTHFAQLHVHQSNLCGGLFIQTFSILL